MKRINDISEKLQHMFYFYAGKVEYWLTSISSFSYEEKDGETFVPPIIIVGSKLDKVDVVS